jgi:MFS family permease
MGGAKGSSWVPAMGNFSVQFNLQVASAAITLLQTYRDAAVKKGSGVHADFAEPAWASSVLKGIVFAGAFVGMIGMGFLGDLLGRRMGMMATLALVVVGALGSAVAPWLEAPGSSDPEAVYAWLTAFRFVLGAGVGGIYPMAAAMAAEAKAAVEDENGEDMEALLRSSWAFFWQSVGACIPYLLALVLIVAVPPSATQTSAQVTALFVLGALPAALVLGLTYQSTAAAAPGGEEQGASAQLRKGQWTAVPASEAAPAEGASGSGGSTKTFWETVAEHPEYLVSLVGTAGTWCELARACVCAAVESVAAAGSLTLSPPPSLAPAPPPRHPFRSHLRRGLLRHQRLHP